LRRRIREALPGSAVLAEIDRRGLALPAWLQALLETALARPVLFVLDDFEHNLQAGEQGGEWAHPEARRCLHALLEALHRAGSESRVIVTSRLTFPLEHPERLAPIPLTAFRDADLRKKIERLEQLRDEGATPAPLRAAAIALGAGNPRLLERLDTALGTAGLDHAALLERLQQARAEFREQLLLRTLVDWLESADRRFLARAALYRLPVPREALAAAGELPDPAAHLRAPIALGLLEPGRLDYGEELYLVPELVADLLVPELDEDSRRAALAAAAALYRLWWTDSASRQWERVTETRRLALEAGQAEAVARTTEWLTDQLLYANEARTAQGLCREALALGDDAPHAVDRHHVHRRSTGTGPQRLDPSAPGNRKLLRSNDAQRQRLPLVPLRCQRHPDRLRIRHQQLQQEHGDHRLEEPAAGAHVAG